MIDLTISCIQPNQKVSYVIVKETNILGQIFSVFRVCSISVKLKNIQVLNLRKNNYLRASSALLLKKNIQKIATISHSAAFNVKNTTLKIGE